ncbi:Protein ASPARTIC PROTEASE IN GUARD CELL 1 [Hibiscus syriacus]|uniref:Protein ASPARTIC PROTEASE IN GUARD CELL 1 n=1 Tax=Hibiscus syriacus TaxID=106335 RepID=A0A6A3C839_HIBSY|nr:protein ASPARTIC PROTEASE IN GUARD CELL 1-like [Hibiscus syriacus]KAE8724011.1 Protein ASPARTIC PROTEASE IN GUARD CELL 1 [Hibiscus syriacus]
MASSSSSCSFHFFLLFSFLFTSTLARLSPESTTTTLDVSSSLQQAHHILSFDPQSVEAFYQAQNQPLFFNSSSSSSSVFSVPLHSRGSVHKAHHTDYKNLVLSRLERDSARVDSLTTKLLFALNGVKKSELKPVPTEIQTEALSTPIISGTSQGSGEYFTRVGVGNPAKQYYMVLDTGSDINWIQCEPCSDCYQQSDPIFNPSGSSTYSPVTCESRQCTSLEVSTCRSGKRMYQVSYGDGSYTVGEFITESVSFGKSGNIEGVALGCGHDNEGLFVGAAGLIGLGGGSLSLTSQIKATSFSYCLVDRDSSGSSTLDFNSGLPAESVVAPLMKSGKINTFYYIGLTGFSVGGQPVKLAPGLFDMDESGDGGVIIDCGTAITRLQTQAYNALRDAFVRLTKDLPTTSGVALFDTCYDLSSRNSVKVPTVSLHFGGGKSMDLPAKNYLIPVDSSGTFCFAFAPTSSSLSIIGNVQQQGTRVSFDLANNKIGFSSHKC